MIKRNCYSDSIHSINGDSNEHAVLAGSIEPLSYEDEIFIDCTERTARAIEKLPEIMDLLAWIGGTQTTPRSVEEEVYRLLAYINGESNA
jgi:hypothetical protein